MGLFGKKSADGSPSGGRAEFAAHPLFSLTVGMSPAEVLERVGPATETKTALEAMREVAGPGANIDPAKVDPEECWYYTGAPEGYHSDVLFREDRLVRVEVNKDGSQQLVVRIDERGVAAAKSYRFALKAREL